MSIISEAFKELKGLKEETFSFDKKGLEKLQDFLYDDAFIQDDIDVIDPNAESYDDLDKSYDGDVTLRCCVCNSCITKDPSQVVIDEDTQRANVEEECPVCGNIGGFEIVAQVDDSDDEMKYDDVFDFEDEGIESDKEEIKEAYDDKYTKLFDNFLDLVEFAVEKDGDEYKLVDLQGANLGDIESDRFETASQIFDRMGIYIEDYYIRAIEDVLEEKGIEVEFNTWEDIVDWYKDHKYEVPDIEGDVAVLDMIVNHADEVDLSKVADEVNESCKKPLKEDLRYNVIEFPSGDYVYVEVEDGKLVAGGATNTGIMHEYELDIEGEEPTDSELQELYELIIEEHPEYEDEITESCKKPLKEDLPFNIIEFPSGDYVYVGYGDGKLYAGGATNTGIFHEYEVDMEGDEPTDNELQDLYDKIIEEHPEYVDQLEESCKKGKKKPITEVKADEEEVTDLWDDVYGEILGDYEYSGGDSSSRRSGIFGGKANATSRVDRDGRIIVYGPTKEYFDKVVSLLKDKFADKGVAYEVEEISKLPKRDIYAKGKYRIVITVPDEDIISDTDDKFIKKKDIEAERKHKAYVASKERKKAKQLNSCLEDYDRSKVDVILSDSDIIKFDEKSKDIVVPADELAFVQNKHLLVGFDDKDDVCEYKMTSRDDKTITLTYIQDFDKSLLESVNNVTISTDDAVTNVTLNGEGGGVNVDVQPIEETAEEVVDTVESEEVESEEEKDDSAVLEPVSDEVKDEIEANSETAEDVDDESGEEIDIDEFDETTFDDLGESYLNRVYDNVKDFKTVKGYVDGNKIMVEGLITFKNGKTIGTTFLFESSYVTKRGKYKFIGENLQFSNKKNAFILTGDIKDKKFITESFTYNYTAKDAKTGNSKRVYGRVKKN